MRKNIYLVVVTIISIVIVFSTVVSAINSRFPFNDVSTSAWYYDEVKSVYDVGIMEGKSETKFDPDANMTRAEFVTVLCRLSKDVYDGMGADLSFVDIKQGEWYVDYVGWGVETDMVKGLPGNKFAPSQAVTRQEMAVFISRFVSYMQIELKDNAIVDLFVDVNNVASFAKEAVELMRISGIIAGDQNGHFNPKSNASRAEIATVITRLLPLLNNGGNVTPPIVNPPDIDRNNFNIQEAFSYSDAENLDGLPYRIYFPEDYTPNKEYPVVFFIGTSGFGTDNTSQLLDAEVLFKHTGSPVFDSIVVVPQAPSVWNPAMATNLSNLIDHINRNFNTNSECVYLTAVRHGVFSAWKMMLLFPEKVSAVLFIHGVGPTVYGDDNGNPEELIDVIPYELKDIPIHFVHDTDDGVKFDWNLGPIYGKTASDALIKFGGFTNVYLTETSGYGSSIYQYFVSEDDASLLEWLFAQRRETK